MTPDEENIARAAIRHTQSVYNSSGDRGKVDEGHPVRRAESARAE